MPRPRKDFTIAVEMYGLGASIDSVAVAHGVTRQAMWKILRRRGVEMRHPEPRARVVWRGRNYTLRDHGYFADTRDGRQYLHRAMWIEAFGPIPDGSEVHHKDGDKQHNTLDNFEPLSSSEHGRAHGFAGNQYVPSLGYRPVK